MSIPNDFEKNLEGLKKFQQNVILMPAQWRSFVPATPLDWCKVLFNDGNKEHVPEQRGIYAFVVQFQDHSALPIALPPHGYVMYAGITGATADRTLRDRYGDYLRDQRRAKRLPIWLMLNKWKDDMYFYYAPVAAEFDLATAEIALNDAIIPPYVTNDFSAEIRDLVRVLRTN